MEVYRSGHNGPDSKSGDGKPSVGSNPTASAFAIRLMPYGFFISDPIPDSPGPAAWQLPKTVPNPARWRKSSLYRSVCSRRESSIFLMGRTVGSVPRPERFFVVPSVYLPSILQVVTVCFMQMVFRSKSMTPHQSPGASLLRGSVPLSA